MGLGIPPEHSRQAFSDLGAKGPGGHLQVPASPPCSLLPPKTGGCLSEGGGCRGEERLRAPSASSLRKPTPGVSSSGFSIAHSPTEF